jgi:hypothetical protein
VAPPPVPPPLLPPTPAAAAASAPGAAAAPAAIAVVAAAPPGLGCRFTPAALAICRIEARARDEVRETIQAALVYTRDLRGHKAGLDAALAGCMLLQCHDLH